MDVVVYGPFHVSSAVWQPSPGSWALVIACRTTFELAPGESIPLAVQDAPASSVDPLEQAISNAPFKRWPEVLLVGHAYAPGGAPVTSLVARLAVGDLDKAIAVYGDRYFASEGVLTEPARFSSMPLGWERAAAGASRWWYFR